MLALALGAWATSASAQGAAGLHVDCRGPAGAGATVVFEAGAFGTSADWDRVLDDISAQRRVCAYDRAGLGDSPRTDRTPRVRAIARDLRSTLDGIGETRPVVLVGHSNGGLYAEAFARMWPGRVAALVLVNAVVTDALDSPILLKDLRREQRLAGLAYLGGRLGLARLVAGSRAREIGLKGPAARQKVEALTSTSHLRMARDEDRRIITAMVAVRAMPSLPASIPVAVLVSSSRPPSILQAAWRKAEVAPAARACRAWVLDLPGGTHVSPLGRDRAYVVNAVEWAEMQAASPPPAECQPAPSS